LHERVIWRELINIAPRKAAADCILMLSTELLVGVQQGVNHLEIRQIVRRNLGPGLGKQESQIVTGTDQCGLESIGIRLISLIESGLNLRIVGWRATDLQCAIEQVLVNEPVRQKLSQKDLDQDVEDGTCQRQ